MREILFRGKRVDNGEWVYGNLIEDKWGDDNGNTVYAILQDRVAPEIAALWTPVKVVPETVGQYTGLTDKNGKKIFEGDIVQGEAEEARGVVEWQQAEGRYLVSVRNGYDWLCMDDDDWCVIGNIHDNPEMLED